MTLTAFTISSQNYDSYASIAEANLELNVDLLRRDDWTALSNDDKGLYLVAATRRLDALNWAGERESASQDNEWPRVNLSPEPSEDIPPELVKATALLAGDLAIDTDGVSAAGDVGDAEVQSHRQGPVSTTYFSRRRDRSSRSVAIVGAVALDCIGQWLEAASIVAPSAYGTDAESSFTPLGKYGRTEGIG